MGSSLWPSVILTILGILCVLLSGWVYLLEPNTRSLLFAGLGVLLTIAGIVNIRRIQSAKGK